MESEKEKEEKMGRTELKITFIVLTLGIFFAVIIPGLFGLMPFIRTDQFNYQQHRQIDSGILASVISVGVDSDGFFKVRVSRGGADLQVLLTSDIDDATPNNLRKLHPGDKVIFVMGAWHRVHALLEVIEGDFNGSKKGSKMALTRRGLVSAYYWNPTVF